MLATSIFIIAVLSLDAASLRWGVNTRDRRSGRYGA
jgi:hypothetical protein